MQKYGLIGYPLKHSFSIGYFNEKFKAENIDAEYVNFEIPRIEDFMEVIEGKSQPLWTECDYPLQGASHPLPGRTGQRHSQDRRRQCH
mgnify:CR=1 FL=1